MKKLKGRSPNFQSYGLCRGQKSIEENTRNIQYLLQAIHFTEFHELNKLMKLEELQKSIHTYKSSFTVVLCSRKRKAFHMIFQTYCYFM